MADETKPRTDHTKCKYAGQPHFVPPSFGQIGFYACDVPDDLTNHTRCLPPYDHESPDHQYLGGR